MNYKEFIQKYEELLNSGYCECNELNCLDNNPPKKILNIMKEQQQEIERLNNIINELECWLRKNLPIEEKNDLQICLNKLEQLKNKKIYGSSKYEVVYFGEALGSDKD